MKPFDRVLKAHVAIMQHPVWCAVSGVIACGETTIDPTIPTASTNGWSVRYSPTFVDSLTDAQLRFVVLHENAGHKAYRHMQLWEHLFKENPQLANIAADHFVNLTIHETDKGEGFVVMPDIGIKPDPKYHGMSVGQIYQLLKQEQKESPDKGEGKGEGEGEGPSMDTHEWGKPVPDNAAEAIDAAIRQGEAVRRAMTGAGSASGVFGDLLTPVVDWRAALREFVQETCAGKEESSWRRPSRRHLADDVYMPSIMGEQMGELVIGFDTSGSCFGSDEMTRFVSEIVSICEQVHPATVHVIFWDTAIAGHQTFVDGQFAVVNLTPKGGGGTNGAVLFDYLREKRINPSAIVQFSDGEVGSFGQSDWPTLWALTTDIRAPYGTTINISNVRKS